MTPRHPRSPIASLALLGSLTLLSAQALAQEEKDPLEGKYRPSVILMKDRSTLRGQAAEGGSHIYVRYPEGTLRLRIGNVSQVFPHAGRLWPKGLEKAWTSEESFQEFLDQCSSESEVHGLVIRAFLSQEGREAANAWAQSHNGRWLLHLASDRAADKALADETNQLLRQKQYHFSRVTLQGDAQVQARFRIFQHLAYFRFPEGDYAFPKEAALRFDPAPDAAPTEDDEAAYAEALAGEPAAFAAYLGELQEGQRGAAILRAALSEKGRAGLKAAAGDLDLGPLMQIVVAGTLNEAAATFAALLLLDADRSEFAEGVAVGLIGRGTPAQIHFGLRLLSTIHARAAEGEHEDLLSRWEEKIGPASPQLPRLWLALGYEDRLLTTLADLRADEDSERIKEIVSLLREARCPFDAGPTKDLLVSRNRSTKSKLAVVEALEVSMDPFAVPALLDALEAAEGRGESANPGYLKALNKTLGILTGYSHSTLNSEGWREAWDELEPRLQASLEALDEFRGLTTLPERLEAWQRVSAIRVPVRQIVVTAYQELGYSRDPKLVSSLLAYLGGLPKAGRFSRPLVRLLEVKELEHIAVQALGRMHRRAGAPKAEAWIAEVNENSYLPPLENTLRADVAGWEEGE